MKSLFFTFILVANFLAFSQEVLITTPNPEVCLGGQGCFSVSTSSSGGLILVNTMWSINGPNGFTYIGNTFENDLCIDLPFVGCYTASALNQYQDGTAMGAQAQEIVCVVHGATAAINFPNSICNSDIPNSMIDFIGNGNIATYYWIIDGVSLPASSSSSIPFPPFWEITDPTTTSATHEVGLIVVDNNGCSDTLDNPGLLITINAPQANFTDVIMATSLPSGNGNEYFCPPLIVNFNDASISSGAPTSSWSWQIGTITSSAQNPQGIQLLYPGTYDLSMQITAGSCIDSLFIEDYLIIHGPTAEPMILANTDICGQSVTFEIANLTNVASWSWNLGDGTTVTSVEEPDDNFMYQYPGVMAYYPVLNLNDNFGCSVSYADTINISGNGVNANFSSSPNEIYLESEVTFTDASFSFSGNIIKWIWNFGDGRIDTLTNGNSVTNQYLSGGEILVTLTVMDDSGCLDQHSINLNVNNFHIGLISTSKELLNYGPNPTNEELIISFPSSENKCLSVTIYTSDGHLVYQSKVNCQEKLKLNTKNLQAGIYFVELNDPSLLNERLKFVKN